MNRRLTIQADAEVFMEVKKDMAIGESYEQLLEKLKPKKSTDDCHTLYDIYDAVIEQLLVEHKQFHKQFLESFKQDAKKMTKTIHEVRISEMSFKAIETGLFDALIGENRGFQKGDLIKFIVVPGGPTWVPYTADDLYEITYVLKLKNGRYVELGFRRSEDVETHE